MIRQIYRYILGAILTFAVAASLADSIDQHRLVWIFTME